MKIKNSSFAGFLDGYKKSMKKPSKKRQTKITDKMRLDWLGKWWIEPRLERWATWAKTVNNDPSRLRQAIDSAIREEVDREYGNKD